MLRPVLRLSLASVFVLLTACGDDGVVMTTGDSSTGETTSDETSTTKNPTTPTTTEGVTTTEGPTTTQGPTTTESTDTSTTLPETGTTLSDTSTTADTSTTSVDTDTDTTGTSECGNSLIETGEVCEIDDLSGQDCMAQGFDAGTLACAVDCATFDTSACVILTCGDGTIEGNEVCDGAALGDQDCAAQGFEGGELACADNCGAFDVTGCFKCGDEILGGAEVCDGAALGDEDCVSQGFEGGELGCMDGCGAFDVSGCFKCGDDVKAEAEVCDGADLDGKSCESEGFDGGALACAVDCGALDTTGCSQCGNNKAEGAEACDALDLKGTTCAMLGADFGTPTCKLDCTLDASTCITAVDETEPNDDGMVAVNTNDFSAMNANGPFTKDTLISAAISPVGDDDVFAVTNNFPGQAFLRVETFGPGGPGTCVGADTVVDLRTAANVLLVSKDQGGIGNCSLIDAYLLAPGETVYVRVIDFGDNNVIASYFLDIKLNEIKCGDGLAQGAEQCDDGNLVNNDGCSATCTIEGTVVEIEPNNTNVEADATGIVSTGKSLFTGAITPIADVDRYRINLAAPQYVRFESFSKLNDCVATTTVLRLFDQANQPIIADTSSAGIGGCGALVFPMPAGTSYVHIEENGNNAVVPVYLLEVATQADAGVETEPNDTLATASTNIQMLGSDVYVFGDHMNGADSDYYAINVPVAGSSLRLELIEGDRAVKTCESLGVDSRLTLYNSVGTQLVDDDDDGRGFCSTIDGTGTTPLDAAAHNLAAGTYYVQVRTSSFNMPNDPEAQFTYRLAMSIRKP